MNHYSFHSQMLRKFLNVHASFSFDFNHVLFLNNDKELFNENEPLNAHFLYTVKLSNFNKVPNRTELSRTNSILSRRTVSRTELFKKKTQK